MKYQVDDKIFEIPEEAIDYCIDEDWHADDDEFEFWVNDSYGSFTINGTEYSAFDIIGEVRDNNYYNLLNEYCEMCNNDDWDNALRELEKTSPGETVEVHGNHILVLDFEEYEDDQETEDSVMALIQIIR